MLLNQLLQQIKTLQQLINQQTIASAHAINGKPNNAFMQCSVLITKTKQQIQNLQVKFWYWIFKLVFVTCFSFIQNQIAAQQAVYVKQQHQSNMSGAYDTFKSNAMHDSINALQTNFADLGINKDPQVVSLTTSLRNDDDMLFHVYYFSHRISNNQDLTNG